MYSLDEIRKTDSEIAELIEAEVARQNSHIELIASENWVSKARLWQRWEARLQINMRKAIRENGFTADAAVWTK